MTEQFKWVDYYEEFNNGSFFILSNQIIREVKSVVPLH